jgi:integrase
MTTVTQALHVKPDDTKFSFTKSRLNKLTEPGTYSDTNRESNGLTLEIRSTNSAKTFRLRKRLNGKLIVVTIGVYPGVTIEQARKDARTAVNLINDGINPNDAKKANRKKHITLEEAFNDYLDFKKLQPSTINGYKVSFKNVLSSLAKKEVTTISYPDVLKVHKAYSERSHSEADRAMRLLRAIFFYAMDETMDTDGNPIILVNPVKKLFKAKQTHTLDRKVRKLEDDQIKPFFEHFEAMRADPRPFFQTGADLLLMLLFHGTRYSETAQIKWHNVDMKYKRFWLDETKGGRRLWLPMNTYTYEVFKRRKALSTGSEYVFPSVKDQGKHLSDVKKPLISLLEETGITITPHDLRRTFLGLGNRLAMSAYTIKQLSNHAQAKNDVTSGYLTQSADELREPSQMIANNILELSGRKLRTDTDSLLIDMLKDLSDDDKRKLIFKLANQQEAVNQE